MRKAEEQIQRAMQEGKFDHLPGKGKPLHLEDNPFEDPEWRLAYHVLRTSGHALPWIETRRELEDALLAARAALQRTWEWRESALAESQPVPFVLAVWTQAVDTFCQRIEDYNQRVLSYNLQAPSDRFHLTRLDADGEIEKITTLSASG
jgi:DnaJ family protein C protein 28